MPGALQIYQPWERRFVRLADLLIAPLGWRAATPLAAPVRRVLLMRLERIGDLLMVLEAVADARAAWPDAEIDLAVGSWNAPLARLIPGLANVVLIDAPWLARGSNSDSWSGLVSKAAGWRGRYDLVVNFEPDIRSNFLAWLTGAPARVGYSSGGGGSFLTDAAMYASASHVSVNATRLVARAAGRTVRDLPIERTWPQLVLPNDAVRRAGEMLAGAQGPLVGVHASGGRESKQWHLDRFAAAAREVARQQNATIVLTGASGDRQLVDEVARRLTGVPVVDVSGAIDLVTLAAVLARLRVLITGDTGPMHLAAAMGTPIVALFGPSNPARYGPLARASRVLRVDLPCSPCGQVRLPPARCRGHVPECLDRIEVSSVVAAALELMDQPR
jgi:lipopolysaccharide heptosyltransferase II